MDSNNLLSIGEIAQALGITRRIILNYEAKGLITPDKKDGDKGNRYYTIDTFTHIRSIRLFQNLGLSLDEIKGYFDESADIAPILHRLEAMRDKLNLTIEKLKERSQRENDEIKMISFETQTIYSRIYNSKTVDNKTNLLRDTALEAMKAYGTDITKRLYFIEYSALAPDEIHYCIAVPDGSQGEHIHVVPETKVLSYFHHGSYEKLPEARKKLISYAQNHNIPLSGLFRHIYLEGPPQHKDNTSRYITQVIAIIKE